MSDPLILPDVVDPATGAPFEVLAAAGKTVARITMAPSSDDGSPGELDGPVTWSADPPGIFTLTFDDFNAQTANVVPTGVPGSARIVARADGDMGSGVLALEQAALLHAVAPLSTHLNLAVSVLIPAPTTKPAQQEQPHDGNDGTGVAGSDSSAGTGAGGTAPASEPEPVAQPAPQPVDDGAQVVPQEQQLGDRELPVDPPPPEQ